MGFSRVDAAIRTAWSKARGVSDTKSAVISTEKETKQLISQLTGRAMGKVMANSAAAGATELRKEVRKSISGMGIDGVGESKKTGTRNKWSKTLAQKRAETKTMRKSIKSKRKSYDRGRAKFSITGVGPLTHLFEKGWRAKFWGRDGYFIKPRPFMSNAIERSRKTVDETVRKKMIELARKELK